jgi:hypothetical protein
MPSLDVWILIVGVVSFIPLYFDLIWRMRERNKIDFKLLRFRKIYQQMDNPARTENFWSIRILHPNRPIEHCSVWYNNVKLRWDKQDEPHYEKYIDTMSGENIQIPKAIEQENATIVIKNGKKTIRKTKFLDIPIIKE